MRETQVKFIAKKNRWIWQILDNGYPLGESTPRKYVSKEGARQAWRRMNNRFRISEVVEK